MPQLPFQHGDQRPPRLFIKFRVLPPALLEVGGMLARLCLEPRTEFQRVAVGPLDAADSRQRGDKIAIIPR